MARGKPYEKMNDFGNRGSDDPELRPAWRGTSSKLSPVSSSVPSSASDSDRKKPLSAQNVPSWHRCPIRKGCVCDGFVNENRWKINNYPDLVSEVGPLDHLEIARQCLPLWSQMADAIAIICLAEREDRFQSACNRLHATGLCAMTVFHRPQRPDPALMIARNIERPGRLGCFEAHRSVAARAVHLNLESVLIFEDDFLILPAPSKIPAYIEQAANCLRSLPSDACDIFMLGGLPLLGFPSLSRLFSKGGPYLDAFRTIAVCNHAYVARRRFLLSLTNTSYEAHRDEWGYERPIDWYATQFKQICFSPQFIGQTCDSLSDISAVNVSWDDRLGPLAVRFARDHPFAYDIGIYVVLPILLLLLLLFIASRLGRYFLFD